jgi:hypothetical protein
LVLEELKNPFKIEQEEEVKEPIIKLVREKSIAPTSNLIWENEGFHSEDIDSDQEIDPGAAEMQAEMEALISDLGLFRKKVAADHEIFGINVA